MKRTPLAPGGPLKRRTPLRPRSNKKQAKALEFQPLMVACYRRDGWECQLRHTLAECECWGPLHPHHILPRGRGGRDELANLVTLCAAHHQWVHLNPTDARAMGFLR